MNFQVPQFIEVEDKIVGPFSFKQFAYLLGGAGASFVFFRMLPLFIAIFFIMPTMALTIALAFFKVNNRPFINILQAAIAYYIGGRLFVWRKQEKKARERQTTLPSAQASSLSIPSLNESRLKDLAWSLDIKEHTK